MSVSMFRAVTLCYQLLPVQSLAAACLQGYWTFVGQATLQAKDVGRWFSLTL